MIKKRGCGARARHPLTAVINVMCVNNSLNNSLN